MGKEKKFKIALLAFVDVVIINLAYIIAIYARFGAEIPNHYMDMYIRVMPIILASYMVPMIACKMYRSIWRIAGIDEVTYGGVAGFIGIVINLAIMTFVPNRIPNIATILAGILIIIGTLGARLSLRFYRRLLIHGTIFMNRKNKESNQQTVLIVGAGAAGQLIINEIRKQRLKKYNIIGLIDDDKNKLGTFLSGVKVIGTRESINKIVSERNIDVIIIAMPSVDGKSKKEIVEICQLTHASVKIIPGMYELIDGEVNLNKMRDVDLRDLLGREEVKLDKEEIKNYIHNKVVLVTGGGGSIGSELCRQIARFNPKQLLILDIYENNAYDLQMELNRTFPNLKKEVLIASVRDKKRLDLIFEKYKPEVVFHAAAHKHVPLMEVSPGEAIKNNVVGTLNTAECAHEHMVKRFVLISTDKAVNPTNVMGATKRLCEMIIQAIDKQSKTEFVAVRFGNVLGSNGSVIPLFKKQIANGGPVTLTNKYITRYFMLIPEAAQLVLQSATYAKGGEIFVLDMGKPVKIYDLAKDLIRLSGFEPEVDIKIEVTGLRPGEKLYEELLMNEEGLENTDHEKIFIGKPGSYDLEGLRVGIKALLEISKLNDEETLKNALGFIVKTYKRSDKVVEEENKREVAATKR